MGAVTPEERRRIAAERQAARQAELARMAQPRGSTLGTKHRGRGLRVALIVITIMLSLAAAWALWTLISQITFDPPATLREWLLPPVTSF